MVLPLPPFPFPPLRPRLIFLHPSPLPLRQKLSSYLPLPSHSGKGYFPPFPCPPTHLQVIPLPPYPLPVYSGPGYSSHPSRGGGGGYKSPNFWKPASAHNKKLNPIGSNEGSKRSKINEREGLKIKEKIDTKCIKLLTNTFW